jgi:hypothetical protein
MVLILTTIVFLYHYYEEGQTTGRNMLVRKQRINHIIQLNCKLLSLYLVDRPSFSNSFYFFTNLIHLVFLQSLDYLSLCLYMFRTNRSIIRRIKCLITQAVSSVVPSVVDLSWVAVSVRV